MHSRITKAAGDQFVKFRRQDSRQGRCQQMRQVAGECNRSIMLLGIHDLDSRTQSLPKGDGALQSRRIGAWSSGHDREPALKEICIRMLRPAFF